MNLSQAVALLDPNSDLDSFVLNLEGDTEPEFWEYGYALAAETGVYDVETTVPSLERNQRPPTEEPNVHFSADEHHMDHETSSMAPAGGIPYGHSNDPAPEDSAVASADGGDRPFAQNEGKVCANQQESTAHVYRLLSGRIGVKLIKNEIAVLNEVNCPDQKVAGMEIFDDKGHQIGNIQFGDIEHTHSILFQGVQYYQVSVAMGRQEAQSVTGPRAAVRNPNPGNDRNGHEPLVYDPDMKLENDHETSGYLQSLHDEPSEKREVPPAAECGENHVERNVRTNDPATSTDRDFDGELKVGGKVCANQQESTAQYYQVRIAMARQEAESVTGPRAAVRNPTSGNDRNGHPAQANLARPNRHSISEENGIVSVQTSIGSQRSVKQQFGPRDVLKSPRRSKLDIPGNNWFLGQVKSQYKKYLKLNRNAEKTSFYNQFYQQICVEQGAKMWEWKEGENRWVEMKKVKIRRFIAFKFRTETKKRDRMAARMVRGN